MPPRCFIREHFPLNVEDQYLKNPISLEKFKHLLENVKDICKYNIEIIEDKIIQNICGKGKVIVNFVDGPDDYHYIMGSYEDYRFPVENLHVPSFVLNRTDKGFEIDLSVNEQGYSSIAFGMIDNSGFGDMYFYCEEEPAEKFYYPIFLYAYYKSDLQLITPIEKYLTKGEKYNFEVKTNDFDELYVKVGGEVISMTKKGNIFKEDNIFIHKESVSISSNETTLIQFSGIGDDIDYPICENILHLKARLIQPLTGTLSKGHEYTFEIACDTEERIIIYCGEIFEVMEREGNIYKATINIETSTTATNLIIEYVKDIMVTTLYKYKVE